MYAEVWGIFWFINGFCDQIEYYLGSLPWFLGAYKHLYMTVCPSFRPSFRPSVLPSVGPSVTPFQNEVLARTYCALRLLKYHQFIDLAENTHNNQASVWEIYDTLEEVTASEQRQAKEAADKANPFEGTLEKMIHVNACEGTERNDESITILTAHHRITFLEQN